MWVSYNTYEWVLSHILTSTTWYQRKSWHTSVIHVTYEWVMAHMNSQVAHMNMHDVVSKMLPRNFVASLDTHISTHEVERRKPSPPLALSFFPFFFPFFSFFFSLPPASSNRNKPKRRTPWGVEVPATKASGISTFACNRIRLIKNGHLPWNEGRKRCTVSKNLHGVCRFARPTSRWDTKLVENFSHESDVTSPKTPVETSYPVGYFSNQIRYGKTHMVISVPCLLYSCGDVLFGRLL